jgi:DNA replication protein DnaC
MKANFMAMVRRLEADGAVATREEVDRDVARNARQERLDRVRPPVTSDDARAIVDCRLQVTPALRAAQSFLRDAFGEGSGAGDRRRFIVLLGEPGRGKTVAGAWALAEYGGYYVSAPELRRLSTSKMWQDQDRFESLKRAKLVVLDDIGAEIVDGSNEEAVFDLVNARQVDRAVTIITGNLTRAQMVERYGKRVVDRIVHQGIIVELRGGNLRRNTQE